MTPQLNRWLNITPITNVLRRARGLLTVPAFTIAPTWNGLYSERVIQFNYSFSRNLGLQKTKGSYLTDYLGVLRLTNNLCWCVRNAVQINSSDDLQYNTYGSGLNNYISWTNLDPAKHYTVILKGNSGNNLRSNTFTGATTCLINSDHSSNAIVYLDGIATFIYAGIDVRLGQLNLLPTNAVNRYILNPGNGELVFDAVKYTNQRLYGSYLSLEGWTIPTNNGSDVVQTNAINLKTTALQDIDTRMGQDSTLGAATNTVTSFESNNPGGAGLLLPITWDDKIINGIVTT